MPRQHHYLKTETQYYQATERCAKKFEVRKNDRDYSVNDFVYLKEVVNGIQTGRVLGPFVIQYILNGGEHGIEKDYCVFQLMKCY